MMPSNWEDYDFPETNERIRVECSHCGWSIEERGSLRFGAKQFYQDSSKHWNEWMDLDKYKSDMKTIQDIKKRVKHHYPYFQIMSSKPFMKLIFTGGTIYGEIAHSGKPYHKKVNKDISLNNFKINCQECLNEESRLSVHILDG